MATFNSSNRRQTDGHLEKPLIAALLAFAGYGSWACWINWPHGLMPASKAFAIQGSFAFAATLTLTLLARYFYRSLGENLKAILSTFCLCFLISLVVPSSLHWAAGTPEIVKSVLPGLTLGSTYILCYLALLHRTSHTMGNL